MKELVLDVCPRLLEIELKLRQALNEHENHACPLFGLVQDSLSVIINARLAIEAEFCNKKITT